MCGTWRGPFKPAPSESPSNSNSNVSSSSKQQEIEPGGQQSFDGRSGLTLFEESHRGDTAQGYWLLQLAHHNPQEVWEPKSCTRTPTVDQDSGPSTSGQQISDCWTNEIDISGELRWKSSIDVDFPPTQTHYALPTSGAQELLPVDDDIMNFDEQVDGMGRALNLALNTRIGSVHIFQRHSMGNSSGTSHVFVVMESSRGEDAHQRQRTAHSILCTHDEEFGCLLGVIVLIQYDHASIYKEVWRNFFHRIAQYRRKNMGSLPENQHEASSYIRFLGTQSSGCSEKINRTDRITEGQTKTSNNDSFNANVEVSDLVSRPHGPVNLTTTPPDSNDDYTRSKKRKVCALEKKELDLDSMEDQRRLLKAQGLRNYAIDWLLSKERRF
ncbi:hypothetical protein AYI70_g12379 [Smittium culicis]|uniref:Uncharacterized protein n=1 Tax=Smittium culicis TaxID=133412 RepID=A0A1R1WXR3_9FUNG|nr:hypothetical protein AYI70_g12379 [Smittium culicis]